MANSKGLASRALADMTHTMWLQKGVVEFADAVAQAIDKGGVDNATTAARDQCESS